MSELASTTPPEALTASVSPIVPDWAREVRRFWEWNPSRALIACIRDYPELQGSRRPDKLVRRWWCVLRHRFWSVVTGAEVSLGTEIGGGFLMPHPNGIVIHPGTRIGPNCMLFQQVTLGIGGPIPGPPTLCAHVDVGAGAKILGGVVIGEYAVVGANAVVLCDVPPGATAVGAPARIVVSNNARRMPAGRA